MEKSTEYAQSTEYYTIEAFEEKQNVVIHVVF